MESSIKVFIPLETNNLAQKINCNLALNCKGLIFVQFDVLNFFKKYSLGIPDPYITFDLLTKYKFNQSLDLYFGIYNLFDRTYYKSANINSTQSSIGIEQFAEPGRHFKCGFKFVF